MTARGPHDVVIVGAGLAGLACARELLAARPTTRLVVLEATAAPGGVIASPREHGFLGEAGPNAFLDGATGAGPLARALGVELAAAPPASRRRWIWKDGALILVPSSPPALLKTDLLPFTAKARVLGESLIRSHSPPGESIAQFLTRRFGRDVAALVGPALVRGVYAGDPAKLEVASCFPTLVKLEAEHGSLLTGLARQARAGGFGLRSAAPVQGMAALVDALVAAVGDVLRRGVRAIGLGRSDAGFTIQVAAGAPFEARHVVLAVPPDEAAALCTTLDPALAAQLAAIPIAGAAVVSVGAARADVAHALDGFGFLTLPGAAERLIGAVFESTLWPNRAPDGHVLVRAIYGGSIDPEILTWDDARLEGQARADLARTIGLRRCAHIRVARWPRALPQLVVGHAARLVTIERGARALGLELAGSGYRGVGVNAAIDAGTAAAARVASSLG